MIYTAVVYDLKTCMKEGRKSLSGDNYLCMWAKLSDLT